MSSNRLHYDKCAKQLQTTQNKNILDHTMDVNMFEHKKELKNASIQPGSYLVATTSRNHKNGTTENLVDVESKLRSLSKKTTKCGQ